LKERNTPPLRKREKRGKYNRISTTQEEIHRGGSHTFTNVRGMGGARGEKKLGVGTSPSGPRSAKKSPKKYSLGKGTRPLWAPEEKGFDETKQKERKGNKEIPL